MIASAAGASLFATPSFEPRSLAGPEAFLAAGGSAGAAFLATLGGKSIELQGNLQAMGDLGFRAFTAVDRFDARSIWRWVWQSAAAAGDDIIVDATCIPREMLAMVLFALSVRRNQIRRVRVLYTAPERYVTLRNDLGPEERWLSRGIRTLRSVVGYPGDFAAERNRHVVALAGHEDDRLSEIISFLEPTRLSVSNEQKESSTVADADRISAVVKTGLRETIGLPEYGEVEFYADSIEQTFHSLRALLKDQRHENVALVAMNTKLSFIGAAVCCLHLRHVRLVYAVPIEYNPHYSEGVREVMEFDVTEMLNTAATIPVR